MNDSTKPAPRRIELDLDLIADLDVSDDEIANLRGGLSRSCVLVSAAPTLTCFSNSLAT